MSSQSRRSERLVDIEISWVWLEHNYSETCEPHDENKIVRIKHKQYWCGENHLFDEFFDRHKLNSMGKLQHTQKLKTLCLQTKT